MFIEIQTVPLLKEIEKRDREGEPYLEISPESLSKMSQLQTCDKSENSPLGQHSVVPLAAPPDFPSFPADAVISNFSSRICIFFLFELLPRNSVIENYWRTLASLYLIMSVLISQLN